MTSEDLSRIIGERGGGAVPTTSGTVESWVEVDVSINLGMKATVMEIAPKKKEIARANFMVLV